MTIQGFTFLQLVQRMVTECGASGAGSNPANPASTVGLTGEYARISNWINSAWLDIQRLHQDWDWMRSSATCNTVTSQANYPLSSFFDINGNSGLTNFGQWIRITGRNYVTAEGLLSEVFMDYMNYDEWRDNYYYGALRLTQSRPIVWSILPSDHSIMLGPVPLVGYTFEVDYFTTPTVMVNDSDFPAMPSQYQMAIIYGAMRMYGRYEQDDQLVADNTMEYNRIMRQMAADRLPPMGMGGPLA